MSRLSKYSRQFAILGIAASLIGYSFLVWKSYALNTEIKNQETEVLELERMIADKKAQLKDLEAWAVQITSTSKDPKTVLQGKNLVTELGISTTGDFKITSKENSDVKLAREMERLGFEALLNKDVQSAKTAFINSENALNGYHQAYDITKLLNRRTKSLLSKDSDTWRQLYRDIASDFSWGMPDDFKEQFEKEGNAKN